MRRTSSPSPRSHLFVVWPGGGNVNPFLGLAEVLQSGGHRVGAIAPPPLAPRLRGAGIEVVAAPEVWLPDGDHVLEAVGRYDPDVLVVDYMLTSALCGAERSGLPTVALVHTLFLALLVDGSPNPIGMAGDIEVLNAVRAGIDLDPIQRHADLLEACELVMVTAPRELDHQGDVATNVAYAGALFEGPGPDADWTPPEGDGPLVVVTVGTAGDADTELDLLGRIVGALDGLPVRVLVTLPDYIEPSRLESPANVTTSGYVRHSAVLPHADLLVTHAGLGSVVVALAHGVPMVCLPLTREQPDNAAAVVRVGAGSEVPADAGTTTIRRAVEHQLERGGDVRFPADPRRSLTLLDAIASSRFAGEHR